MEKLPTELKFIALYDVPFPDVLNICSSAAEYQELCNDDNFWRLKAQHQLGISPKKFKETNKSARERFIQLYLQKYPIPGCDKYNSLTRCTIGLLDLMAQGDNEFQDYDLFELLQYYLSMDTNHRVIVEIAFLTAFRGLVSILYYLLNQANQLSDRTLHLVYHNALKGAGQGNQIELLNILIAKAVNSKLSFKFILDSILDGVIISDNVILLKWLWDQHGILEPYYIIDIAIKYKSVNSLDFLKTRGIDVNTYLIESMKNNKYNDQYTILFIDGYLS